MVAVEKPFPELVRLAWRHEEMEEATAIHPRRGMEAAWD